MKVGTVCKLKVDCLDNKTFVVNVVAKTIVHITERNPQ